MPIKFVQEQISDGVVRQGKAWGFSVEKIAALVDWSRQNVAHRKQRVQAAEPADGISLQFAVLLILQESGPLGLGALYDEARRRNLGAVRKGRVDRDRSSVSLRAIQAAVECLIDAGEILDLNGEYSVVQPDTVNLRARTLGEHR